MSRIEDAFKTRRRYLTLTSEKETAKIPVLVAAGLERKWSQQKGGK